MGDRANAGIIEKVAGGNEHQPLPGIARDHRATLAAETTMESGRGLPAYDVGLTVQLVLAHRRGGVGAEPNTVRLPTAGAMAVRHELQRVADLPRYCATETAGMDHR